MKIPIVFPETEPEAEEVNIIREHDREIVGWMERPWHILLAYQAHQLGRMNRRDKNVCRLRMSAACMALALGYPVAAGAQGPAELAKRFGLSKQMVGKCLNHFIEQLGLGPLPGQRDQDAREKMADARRRQVATKKETK